MVRVGILGLGNIGKIHMNNILEKAVEGAVVTAVYNPSRGKLDELEKNHGKSIKYYTDIEKFWESREFDGVIICSPHYEHPAQCRRALENGYHVLSEKPVGVYTKEVEELIEVSKKSDKKFGIIYNQRTKPIYKKIKEMVEDDSIGRLKRVNWIVTESYRTQGYYDSSWWRASWGGEGGGVLINQSFHQLDLLQWICGMPKKVRGFCHFGKERNVEVETDATIYTEYEGGATGIFVTSTIDCPGSNRLEITGDKGKIVAEGGKLRYWKLKEENEYNDKEQTFDSNGKFVKPEFEEIEVILKISEKPEHALVVENWIDSIEKDTPLIARGEEGIDALSLVNAAYLSTFLNKEIELPLDSALYLNELNKRTIVSKVKKELKIK